MKELLKKKLEERKKKSNQRGFTLIEILVVLVIMGFLVAMVAPKMAGISDRAMGVTDQNSQKRLQEAMQIWINERGAIPPSLANLVATTYTAPPAAGAAYTNAGFAMASIDDGNAHNGAEVISSAFAERWLPMPHFINKAEAIELRDLIGGSSMQYALVTTLYQTDHVKAPGRQGDINERFARRPIREGMAVMMIGAGMTALDATSAAFALGPQVTLIGSDLTVSTTATQATNFKTGALQLSTGSNFNTTEMTYARIVEGPMALRIVMGMTDRNMIVNAGLLDKAGVSPASTQSRNYEFGNYFVVVPRLQATVDRFLGDTTSLQANTGGVGAAVLPVAHVLIHAIAFTEHADGTYSLVARTPYNPHFQGVALPGQAVSNTVILSPEGDKWAASRSDWFGFGMALGTGRIVL